ncbi:MAG: NAD+ synthase [Patescibacteria group bacterium]|nr:NAD+ synthase [Patescibacteria group bacterium]
MEINPAKEVKKITDFLKTTFKSQGFKKGIVAVSGGIDSSVALALAVNALGKDNIYTLELPYKRQSIYYSTLIINQLKIPTNQKIIIKLSRSVDKLAIKLNAKKNRLRFGNILARTRMTCLFDQSKKLKTLVIGTENKSEKLLGYYTRFGDEASDINPISHLYKLQIIKLAKYLKIPPKIISQAPSAGLWKDQTDEKELGFSYLKADPILKLLIDKKIKPKEIIKQGYDKTLLDKITKRLLTVDFKTKVPYHI